MFPKIKRQGILSIIVIYMGIGLGYVNLILLMPKYFSLEEIGLRSLLTDFVTVFHQICMLGFASAAVRFYPRYQSFNSNGFLTFIFIIPLLNFFILGLALYTGKSLFFDLYSSSPLFYQYFYLVFPFTLFVITSNLLEAYLKNFYKAFVPNFLREFFPRLSLLILILSTVFLDISRELFWNLYVITYGVQALFLILYIMYLGKFDIKLNIGSVNKSFIKEVVSFSFYAVLNATVTILIIKFDILMIGSSLGLAEVGIYSTMVYVATLAEIPKRVLSQFASPQIAKSWHNNDTYLISNISKKYSKAQVILASIICIIIFYCSIDLFEILKKEEFRKGAFALVIILITKMVISLFGPINEIMSFSPKYRLNLIFNLIGCFAAIVLNLLFIPSYGIEGAAIATLLALGINLILKSAFLRAKFQIISFDSNIYKIIGLFALISAGSFFSFVVTGNPIVSVIIKTAVVIPPYIGLLFILKLVRLDDFEFKEF